MADVPPPRWNGHATDSHSKKPAQEQGQGEKGQGEQGLGILPVPHKAGLRRAPVASSPVPFTQTPLAVPRVLLQHGLDVSSAPAYAEERLGVVSAFIKPVT